jgi:hypothetical protein
MPKFQNCHLSLCYGPRLIRAFHISPVTALCVSPLTFLPLVALMGSAERTL